MISQPVDLYAAVGTVCDGGWQHYGIRTAIRGTTGNFVILLGAGIIAESRLGMFKDIDGMRAQFNPAELASRRAFAKDPARIHAFCNRRRAVCVEAEPNAARLAQA